MKYQYSVVFLPSFEIRQILRKLKKELRLVLKEHFASENSEAHISLFEFLGGEADLDVMEDFLIRFCRNLTPFPVRLNRFGRMESTYCVFPDKLSKEILVNIMEQLHRKRPGRIGKAFKHPHVSIGRELKEEQLALANLLFGKRNIMFEFLCDSIVMRRRIYNSNDQYEIYKQIEFAGKPELLLF